MYLVMIRSLVMILKADQEEFQGIFDYELVGWCTDGNAWPRIVGLRVVMPWFYVKVHAIALDIGKNCR